MVPLTACDLEQRTSSALQTACQSLGMKGTGGSCPLALTMHGSCGGAKLQVCRMECVQCNFVAASTACAHELVCACC